MKLQDIKPKVNYLLTHKTDSNIQRMIYTESEQGKIYDIKTKEYFVSSIGRFIYLDKNDKVTYLFEKRGVSRNMLNDFKWSIYH